ncbi:MAG: DUF2249 domain-containing protein [Dehalococcoidia bacterium]|nr:DUF2249 domain-containing protein [Dehalococcoidia bacterium]
MSESSAVTLNMKLGQVLKEHPELLSVLVAQSPEFKRFKNPVVRSTHGRLVTVSQAAAVAGLDPATLVRSLNAAIGQESPEMDVGTLPATAATPPPPWLETAPRAVEIDVREHQRRHEDPFPVIMSALAKVEKGQVMLLRNTFEPLPLYDVLGKKGFVNWARETGPHDWEIFFFKLSQSGPVTAAAGMPAQKPVESGDWTDEPTATITIDVRELTPPQPLLRILDALGKLEPGDTLLVHHARNPIHLYAKLAELGCMYKTIERGPGQVDLYIRKGSNT